MLACYANFGLRKLWVTHTLGVRALLSQECLSHGQCHGARTHRTSDSPHSTPSPRRTATVVWLCPEPSPHNYLPCWYLGRVLRRLFHVVVDPVDDGPLGSAKSITPISPPKAPSVRNRPSPIQCVFQTNGLSSSIMRQATALVAVQQCGKETESKKNQGSSSEGVGGLRGCRDVCNTIICNRWGS